MNEERLLKLPEVATRLALSRTAIYRLMARGELQPIRIGGALRFPASTIDRLIEKWKGNTHVETL
jgi:excisionase family DNA binding protein